MDSIKVIDVQPFNSSFLKFIRVTILLGLSFVAGTCQARDLFPLKSYVGLEFVHRSLAFKEGYGKGNFNKSMPQGNAFLGIAINPYLGLEIGYLFSPAVTRTSVSSAGQVFGGQNINPTLDEFIVSENKLNITGPEINMVGKLPLGNSDYFGVGLLGISWLNLKVRVRPLINDETIYTPAIVEIRTRHFASRKLIPKIMLGIGYSFTESIKLRLLAGY